MATEKERSIMTVLGDLNEKADLIFRNQYLLAEYSSIPRDYGNGYLMTEVEAHTLGFISDQEGITATELARNTHRTKGGISKLISKLEGKGFVKRVNEINNRRTYRLYLTEDGKRACETHRDYDREHMLIMINLMLEDCTTDEILAFFKVLATRNRIIDKQFEEGQLRQ